MKGKVMRNISIVKIMQVKEGALPYETATVSCNNDAAKIVEKFLEGVDREHFGIMCLNAKNRINAINTVSIGAVDQCMVTQRECYKAAILSNSVSVIFFHNHPSGDPEPSRHDINLTKALIDSGKILGITVHDHIIIGSEGSFVSIRDKNSEMF